MRTHTGQLLLWSGITLAHFALTALTIRRWAGWSPWPLDARLFATVLGGVGLLSAALHLAALTVGVGLVPVGVVLATWHLTALLTTRGRSTAHPSAPLALSALEFAAATALATIVLSWISVASLSAEVGGTDAAHYHVPVAANLALGARLFDLPATQHVYPMAGSAIASWFMVPVRGPLIIELAMCLPFLVTVAAFNLLFRLTTGLSGLAWSTWFSLVLFSTPLFRQSSLVSADLWFTAAFVAGLTTILWAWREPRWTAPQVLLGAIALGLLLGSKTTGAFAAVLLLSLSGVDLVRRLWRRSQDRPPARIGLWGVATVFTMAAGGIWLVRNWLMFGSPVAPTGLVLFGRTIFDGDPFGPTTYLSVLGDMEKDASYDLGARVMRYLRLWVGRWAVPSLAITVVLAVDGMASRRSGADPRRTARLLLAASTVVFGILLGTALVGAPWTSLEWTRGFSLRYALPIVALALFLPAVALFPLRWPWYASRDAAAVAALIAAGSVALLVISPTAARSTPLPPWQWPWVPGGVLLILAGWWISRWASPGRRLTAWTAMVLVLSAVHATTAADRLAHETDRLTAAEERDLAAFSRGQLPASPAREVYLRVLADETGSGRSCEERRVVSLTRFDEPLQLQPALYGTQVFYAGRPTRFTRPRGPVSSCDYVITTAPLMDTIRGRETASQLAGGGALRELGRSGEFVILAVGPAPAMPAGGAR